MKDKLNIAMLGHKRVPSREGGVEIVVEALATRMVEAGHRVTCYNRAGHHTGGSEHDGAKHRTFRGVRLKTVPTVNRRGLAAASASFFAAVCAAFGTYDVVHFHAEGPCAMLWLPRLFGKRCIATIHGLDWQRAKWGGFAGRYIKFGEKVAAKYAHEIIVLSRGVQQYFQDTYGRQTVLIPNGVTKPTPRESRLITERFGLERDGYILFLGRLVPEKGLRCLVEAFRGVRTEKKLVIAGGSSDTDAFVRELKALARQDDRILFTGFVQDQLLEELYSNAYVYTLPSDLEGMPLSLLEAMSYGNCCLVSNIPECADVVQHCGLTFKRGDASDLRDKLQYLCDHPEAVAACKAVSSDFICEKYNWDTVTRQTLELYAAADRKQDKEA